MRVAKPGHVAAKVIHYKLHNTFPGPHVGAGPGAGPVRVKKSLEPYLPVLCMGQEKGGYRCNEAFLESIGRAQSFYGKTGISVGAYAYVSAVANEGLSQVAHIAVLNTNYVRERLESFCLLASDSACVPGCVFSDRSFRRSGVRTSDIAKCVLDYGFYAPTTYFLLAVGGAPLIEPTETETKETLDEFSVAYLILAEEIQKHSEGPKQAVLFTPISRLDETRANRHPVLSWREGL